MKKTRVYAATAVLALVCVTACNRTETKRDADRAAEQMKQAAAQAGEKFADSWLTTKIQAQFFADDDIKSRYITVRSRDGVVTLKGFVESDDARRQVLEITRSTDGVKQVDDKQLLVGRPVNESFDVATTASPSPVATSGAATGVNTVPTPTDDATVVSVIRAKYFLDPAIKSRNIDVQVANGVVTLKGSIASENERQLALLLARGTSGVQRVEDYMAVDAGLQ
jgi:hyperosmotically inducible protein